MIILVIFCHFYHFLSILCQKWPFYEYKLRSLFPKTSHKGVKTTFWRSKRPYFRSKSTLFWGSELSQFRGKIMFYHYFMTKIMFLHAKVMFLSHCMSKYHFYLFKPSKVCRSTNMKKVNMMFCYITMSKYHFILLDCRRSVGL